MTEQVPDWLTIFDAIEAKLRAIVNTDGNPAFLDVIPGEPMGLPPSGPYACFWYLGREDSISGQATLGNVMYAARVQVMVLWPAQSERTTLRVLEADIATIDTSIRRAFRADSVINSNLTDLHITDSQLDYGDLPIPGPAPARALYRVLQMELRLENLEGEAIAA